MLGTSYHVQRVNPVLHVGSVLPHMYLVSVPCCDKTQLCPLKGSFKDKV